jgi:hypothetical protein
MVVTKNCKGCGRNWSWSKLRHRVPYFAWWVWERRREISVKTVGIPTEIRKTYLWNTKKKKMEVLSFEPGEESGKWSVTDMLYVQTAEFYSNMDFRGAWWWGTKTDLEKIISTTKNYWQGAERYDTTQFKANTMRWVEKPKQYLQHVHLLEGCCSWYHKNEHKYVLWTECRDYKY